MRPIDAEPSEGRIKLHSAIHGNGAYDAFKRTTSEFYTNHTYKFVALTLDGEPRPDIVTFTAEFWRVPSEAATPSPNDPLTLEELREMDGEPVWVERPGYESRWALVQVWAKSTDVIYLMLNNGVVLYPQVELDSGAKIYRRKPEEGDGVGN